MRVCLASGDVVMKHVRTTYNDRITGLVDQSPGSWSEGYNYQLRNEEGEEFLAELVDVKVDVDAKNTKTRLTFEK